LRDATRIVAADDLFILLAWELLADGIPKRPRRSWIRCWERMREAVHPYEGTVNQVLGDGVVAVASAAPALRASRLVVREALAYE
jgi:hypothetical protein